MFATKISLRVLGGLAVLGGASLLAGCALANTTAASPTSAYTTVPETYSVVSTKDVAKVVLDRSPEGVVLSVNIDDVAMPTTWAKVYKRTSDSTYWLYGTQVTPPGTDYVTDGTDYYVKTLRIGSTTGATPTDLIFTATASGSSITWSATDGTATVTLPDANLTAAYQKWYWAAMAAGNYSLRSSTTTTTPLVTDGNLVKTNDDTGSAVSGATLANRWFLSTADSTWKTGRNTAVSYLVGKNLIGTTSAALASTGNRWTIGTDLTTVDTSWSLATYWPTILTAFTTASATVDATTSASAAE